MNSLQFSRIARVLVIVRFTSLASAAVHNQTQRPNPSSPTPRARQNESQLQPRPRPTPEFRPSFRRSTNHTLAYVFDRYFTPGGGLDMKFLPRDGCTRPMTVRRKPARNRGIHRTAAHMNCRLYGSRDLVERSQNIASGSFQLWQLGRVCLNTKRR